MKIFLFDRNVGYNYYNINVNIKNNKNENYRLKQ